MRSVFHALVLAMGVAASALPATARETILTYDAHLGGFDVARVRMTLHLAEESRSAAPYRLTSTIEAAGLLGSFTSFTSRSTVDGEQAGPRVTPHSFRADSTWRGEDRVAVVTWEDPAAPPRAEVQPPPQADEREPVPPVRTVGSLDPLSALLHLVRGATPEGAAAPPVTVYDGRRLFRLSPGPLVPAAVETEVYGGPGYKTEIRYDSLGGASRKWKSRDTVTATAALAPAEALGVPLILPVRLTVPLQGFGALVLELTAVRTDACQTPPVPNVPVC